MIYWGYNNTSKYLIYIINILSPGVGEWLSDQSAHSHMVINSMSTMGLVAVYLPVPHTLSGSLMCVIYDTYTTHQGAIDEVHSSQTKLVQLLQC